MKAHDSHINTAYVKIVSEQLAGENQSFFQFKFNFELNDLSYNQA